jgi:hypothetical protein
MGMVQKGDWLRAKFPSTRREKASRRGACPLFEPCPKMGRRGWGVRRSIYSALTHGNLEMTRMRVCGILAGYEDQNDHDALPSDAVFKLIAGRSPEDAHLASRPTLSRFENAIGPKALFALRDVLIDEFIASFRGPPTRLTFDLDTFDDPTHGDPQRAFFHGYCDQCQYLPRVITCAEKDHVVIVSLLFGTASPTPGAAECDLE